MNDIFEGKSILITGGTGSFGNYFTEYLLKKYKPKRIVIFSRDEYKQFLMKEKFKDYADVLRFFIGDVRDKDRLMRAFSDVNYVVHAAAMKQVPACEYNPLEAIRTNINGAANVIDAAIDQGVERVVALYRQGGQPDQPVRRYQARVGQIVCRSQFVCGAGKNAIFRGPIRQRSGQPGIGDPLFAEQIRQGVKNLPVTDREMTRFWIHLETGVKLVLHALETAGGGEVFIAKIPSFKIVDLAEAMNPGQPYEEVGIREGEKLHEIMITREDARRTYEYNKYYVIYPELEWFRKYGRIIPGGTLVEPSFEYSSGRNKKWLSVDELRRLVSGLEYIL